MRALNSPIHRNRLFSQTSQHAPDIEMENGEWSVILSLDFSFQNKYHVEHAKQQKMCAFFET